MNMAMDSRAQWSPGFRGQEGHCFPDTDGKEDQASEGLEGHWGSGLLNVQEPLNGCFCFSFNLPEVSSTPSGFHADSNAHTGI